MKISIVTLSFNQAKYLRESINSVLDQSYQDWELIIIDPGSTDSSRDIALHFAEKDSRISLLFEADKGPSDGLNKGFHRATGQIIGCLNADDYYMPGTFNQVVRAFNRFSRADCIYSHGLISKSGKLVFQSSDKFTTKRYFSNRGLVLQQATFFRNSKLIQSGVNFNLRNRTSWDGEFLVDLATNGGIFKKVFGNWGVFRIYDDSITGSGRLEAQAELDHLRMLDSQVSKGFHFSLLDKIFLKFRFYSVYRRLRNLLLKSYWHFYSRLNNPA
jgi:glycosyltransferase involved in cell wall biosynthesis